MPNRLARETSPYLLQHQNNPVDWYPWGAEALERARAEQKPIFLSVGYSACHWCHVMEHESFENEAIAALMNEHFVCIKVDREERPDLDQIYMHAVQLMTGRGGWPMSVFLTPDLRPFFGGTYWPARSRGGMPGFDRVLVAVAEAWRERRPQAIAQADELTQHLAHIGVEPGSAQGLRTELLSMAGATLLRIFDSRNGGFGGAPKFPHPMDLQLLLRLWQRESNRVFLDMVRVTLDRMARGGIYDHLGGGFARYSVDERWLVPHFEKMLYDNSLLAVAYLEAYQVTGDAELGRVVRETLDYLLAEMRDPHGGFHSTEDADSEGEEGKYYVWTPAEIAAVLGPERAARFCVVYDVSERGNFEHGKSILNLPKTLSECARLYGWDVQELEAELADSRARLRSARQQRVRPGRDDKVLVSWNALAIEALARAAVVFDDGPRYLEAARGAAEFILQKMQRSDGRLLHAWCQGQARFDAYLDDYAYLANALVTLYEADFDERWIAEAVKLADSLLRWFRDPQNGGFYFTADDHEPLIARTKDVIDSSVPSGNAMAALALLRLGKLTGNSDYLAAAQETLELSVGLLEKSPTAGGQMLLATDFYFGPSEEWVFVGEPDEPETADVLQTLRRRFVPRRVLACRQPSGTVESPVSPSVPVSAVDSASIARPLDPLFAGRMDAASLPALYRCQGQTCAAPLLGVHAIRQWLETT